MTEALRLAAHRARERAQDLQVRSEVLVTEACATVAAGRRAHPDDDTTMVLSDAVDALRAALQTRVAIAKASSIIATAADCDDAYAFELLVRQARHAGRRLGDVAADVVRHAPER